MAKYNHAFEFAFEVVSDDENGEDVTAEQLIAACRARLDRIEKENVNEMLEACGAPFDSFEVGM